MRSACCSLLLVAAGATTPAAAQQVRELGVQGVFTASDPALGAGGLYAALRASLRLRFAGTVLGGISQGNPAGRGELLLHFLLSPTSAHRAGWYVGGGVAGTVGPVDQGYVVALVGVEGRPGARSGWAVEAGVGGGARLSAGYRWRWFPAGWPGSR